MANLKDGQTNMRAKNHMPPQSIAVGAKKSALKSKTFQE